MSISMKNLSDRITALENKINSGALGGWEKGSGNGGFWVREKTTGLTIQWGICDIRTDQWKTFDLPTPFKTKDFGFNVIGTSGRDNEWANGFDCTGRAPGTFSLGGRCAGGTKIWIAIGYLISYRILNYIYKGIMHFLCGKKLKIFGLNKGGVK